MRRSLSWARSPKSVAIVFSALMPGLLVLSVLPAEAQVPMVGGGTVDQREVVTPKQMAGTAGRLPSLVDTSLTSAVGDTVDTGQAERAPEALALESRSSVPATTTTSKLPAGVERAEQIDRLTMSSTTFPIIDDVYPEHGMLIGTVTPLLTTEATRLGGGSSADLKFTFKICEKLEEDEDEVPTIPPLPAPTPECFTSGAQVGEQTWRVPAGSLQWGKQYEWWVRVVDVESAELDQSDKQLVTTGARQPLTSAHLGERGGEGQEFSPVAGNYTTSFVDARIPAAGPPLSVVRTYNSLDARTNGIFGAGWSTQWDMRIVAEDLHDSTIVGYPLVPRSVLLTSPSGSQARFAMKGASTGDFTFQPPPGMHATLKQLFEPAPCTPGISCNGQVAAGWQLMDKASTSYFFNAQGRLTKISDRRGRSQTLTYGGDGKLTTVTAVGGRSLHFTWADSRVASVSTDPVNGQSATWTYTYTGDNLTSVCAPVAAPNCTNHTYADGSRYRSIVLDSEPVGYFRFGEGQYEAPANEGSDGRSGQYNAVTVGQPGALEGSTDTAAGFTQSNVMLPSYILARLRDRVSIEGWFKTTQRGMIFSAAQYGYAHGATQPVLYIGTDGRLRGQLVLQ